ncbi:MAG TPA: baseplate J/gp47 family protein [Anaerolineae bacterium]|nr:baseplate J/gp47 family protein [Anaerolineae bacterium]
MTSYVPTPQINANGVSLPAQSDILNGVLADLNAAFGGQLNTQNLSTPQGQLASSITAYIADSNSMFSYFVSQVDPQYAQGFMQDAIGRIFGMTRLPATFTKVTTTCVGLAGTVIPADAQAQDTAGNLYTTPLGGTIGVGGSTTVVFYSVLSGPVACGAGTLTKIMTTTPGWDSVTNTNGTETPGQTDTVIGVAVESAQAFEYRRSNSLYANAQSVTQAIQAAVMASGATLSTPKPPYDALVYENGAAASTTINGATVLPNTIFVCVAGGDPTSIANAIWSKKPVGCGYSPGATIAFNTTAGSGVITVSSITGNIAVGDKLIMTNSIPFGATGVVATITAFGTGTGYIGTYSLSVPAVSTTTGATGTTGMQVTVTDTTYAVPQPTYNVLYAQGTSIPLYVSVQLVNSAAIPSNYITLVQNAVIASLTGTDGGTKSRLGATIYGTRFYSGILAAIPQAQIISVLVGTTPSPSATSYAPGAYAYCTAIAADITVTLV